MTGILIMDFRGKYIGVRAHNTTGLYRRIPVLRRPSPPQPGTTKWLVLFAREVVRLLAG